MNALELAIDIAIKKNGEAQYANKAYLEFIKANFMVPIEKPIPDDPEPRVLYLLDNSLQFLPVFTNQNYFDAWAKPIREDIQILKLTGVNLLNGLGENTYISLNPGSTLYKEFNPSELARMRNMIAKLFRNT